MKTAVTQRWLFGLDFFRDATEPVRSADWEVVRLTEDAEAKSFVIAHHYSGSYTAARERFGLVHARTMRTMGIAVFDVPAQPRCLDVLPGERAEKLHFGRLVLLPEVPGNGESLFIGECFRQLRRSGYTGVVSFADPAPRTRVDGEVIHPGHTGGIYQATNGRLVGRSRPDRLWLLPDGSALHRRAMVKVCKLEQGWRYVVERLVHAGAPELELQHGGGEEDRARAVAWLTRWRANLCRPMPHPGNWKYVWGFGTSAQRHLEKSTQSLPYPEPPGGRPRPKWGRRTKT